MLGFGKFRGRLGVRVLMWGTNRSGRFTAWSKISPARRATISSLVYILICSLYILVSSRIAASLAQSTRQLQEIEALKGIGFVVVTGLIFFLISLAWWKRIAEQGKLLIEAERRSVAAMYSASLAHDLNNLLMSLLGLLEGLKGREEGDPLILRMRQDLERSVDHLTRLSRRMTRSTKELNPQDLTVVDIKEEIQRILELIRKHSDVSTCLVDTSNVSDFSIFLAIDLFDQALINLVINAAQAAGPGGRIELAATHHDKEILIEIHDSGPGISEDRRESIFDPGVTSKPDGTGLGLLSVQAFVSSLGGRVSVGSSPLGGALFQLMIPIQEEPRVPPK